MSSPRRGAALGGGRACCRVLGRGAGLAAILALLTWAGAAPAQPAPATPPAVPAPPMTREEALARIASGDVETRRQAAAALGDVGAPGDAAVLLRALRDADAVVRALAERSVWEVWSRSGDPEIDALFAVGLEQMSQRAARAAIETFGEIIRRKPDFAEGWNKRATLYFLVGEYEKSRRDCDEVVKRNPNHFGVLAGYGQIYLRLDRPELALPYFERALRINPNLVQVERVVEQLRQLLIQTRRHTL